MIQYAINRPVGAQYGESDLAPLPEMVIQVCQLAGGSSQA